MLKNLYFYKAQVGASIANVLTSVIAPAYSNDINPYQYLIKLQKNKQTVNHQRAVNF